MWNSLTQHARRSELATALLNSELQTPLNLEKSAHSVEFNFIQNMIYFFADIGAVATSGDDFESYTPAPPSGIVLETNTAPSGGKESKVATANAQTPQTFTAAASALLQSRAAKLRQVHN